MIFVGDIALPYENAIELRNLPDGFRNKSWFGNLEGGIVKNSHTLKKKRVVYNDSNAIGHLFETLNFKGLALANNHILDAATVDETLIELDNFGVSCVGLGVDKEDAANPLIISESGRQFIILNYGWEVIQCEVASSSRGGVNPLEKSHVISTFKGVSRKYPNIPIIVYFHWSYELEAEPQPRERELAKYLVDLGAFGIIGCHPHRIGGFEIYKGRPILYSLGNWLFKQNYYFDGKLRFPKFCDKQLAFEWDLVKDEFKFHFFSCQDSTLVYISTEPADSETMKNFTPFRGLDNKNYIKWYKKNHFHRNKGLPIYYWYDTDFIIYFKDKVNRFRDSLIDIVVKFRK